MWIRRILMISQLTFLLLASTTQAQQASCRNVESAFDAAMGRGRRWATDCEGEITERCGRRLENFVCQWNNYFIRYSKQAKENGYRCIDELTAAARDYARLIGKGSPAEKTANQLADEGYFRLLGASEERYARICN